LIIFGQKYRYRIDKDDIDPPLATSHLLMCARSSFVHIVLA